VASSTAEIKLIAIVEDAAKSIKKFSQETQKQLDSIDFKTNILAINAGFELIGKTAGKAFGFISGVISDSVKEAADAEQAITNLSNALRLQNDYSQQAVTDFREFADSLQKVTVFTDDAAINSLALAKQFRATNSEAKRVVTVAADLAAITGTDLQSATYQVAQTLNGFVDKSLAKAIPGLKALSKEALISGAAIDVIGQRVSGSAEALSNTFNGAVTKTKNSFSDLLETIGGFVTENPVILESLRLISKTFNELNDNLKANGVGIKKAITDGFLFFVTSAPAVVNAVRFIDNVISTTAVTFYTLGRSIGAVAAALVELAHGNFSGIKEINDAVTKENADAFKDNREKLKNFYDPVLISAEKLAKEIESISKETKSINKGISTGPSLSGAANRQIKKTIEEQRKLIEDATKDPIKVYLELSAKGAIDKDAAIAIGTGLVSNIVKGTEGAKKQVAAAFGAIADTLLPGIGGAVSEIVNVLGEGPDKTRELVRSFYTAIPQIVQNIADAFPVVVEEIAKNLPPALAKTMPTVAIAFSTNLIKNIPSIVSGFANALVQSAKTFVQELIKQIPGAGQIFGGDGGGIVGQITGGIGDFFSSISPFAEGGRVPDIQRFMGDKFPARLNAGEQVLSRDLSNKLENYLTGNGTNQNLEVNIVIGEEKLAKAILSLNRRGFRTA